jgi:ketosteroid isomerase-like protein
MSVFPAPGSAPESLMAADELRQLEAARYVAMTERDFDTLGRLFDDRLTYTHSSGVRDTKQQYLQAVQDSVYVYGAIEHTESLIHVVGDAAVVHAEMKVDITIKGIPKTLRNAATSVWVRSNTAWRLLSYQTTALPAS